MVEILAIVLVLALVFAAKTFSILRTQDDAIGKSVSFSWTTPEVAEEVSNMRWDTQAIEDMRAARMAPWRRHVKAA